MTLRINLKIRDECTLDLTSCAVVKEVYPSDTYDGDYSVTPTVEGFELATSDKIMTDNLEVQAIPASPTNNPAGGITFSIAS